MSDDTLPGLDHYALKSMDYGQLTGLAIACHAIPDVFLLMHVGVGCKNKATAHLLVHDWKEHGNVREGWTEVGDKDLILGASARAAPYLRSWYKRLEPSMIVVTSVTFIDLAGEDLQDKLAVAAESIPCPVRYVKAPGYDPDMYVGYSKLLETLAKDVDWSKPADKPNEVLLLGYMFDRYEGDHQGNLAQIKGLLEGIGLSLGPAWLSGAKLSELLQAHRSGHVVELPYTKPVRKRLRRALKGRSPVETDLPIGVRGTSRWLRAVGAGCGVAEPVVERFVKAREAYVLKQLDTMMDRWRSRRVAVIAELPLAAGLCSLLIELGFNPVLVGIRGESLGGAEDLHASLTRDGLRLEPDAVVLENPSLFTLRGQFEALLEGEGLDGVFGAAPDLNMLTTLSPKLHVHARSSGAVEPQGPFLVEIGFPSRDFHAMMPMPFMGYGGVIVLAQRIADARRLWDSGRVMTWHL